MSHPQSGRNWIGQAPSDWQVAPLGHHFDERKEIVSDRDFRPLSVTKNGIVPQLETAAKTDNNDNRKLVRIGDFAINSRSDRKGSSGVSQLEGSVSMVYTVLTPRASIDRRYAHHLLRSTGFQEEYYRWGNGIVADLWSTRYSAMKSISLALPDLAVQQAIADYLDRETAQIDTLIAKQEQLIERLRERRDAVVERETIRPQTSRWTRVQLKRAATLIGGGTPDTENLSLWAEPDEEGATAWTAIGDMSGRDHVTVTKKAVTPEGVRSKRLTIGQPGLVLFAMYASVGEVSTLRVPAAWNQALLGIHPNEDALDGGFLAHQLRARRRDLLADVRSNTQSNLNAAQVGSLELLLPPLDEQRRIVAYLDEQTAKIDTLISKAERFIELAKERRAALITATVTGQLDVTAA